jgi:hypothetical protein
MQLIICWLVFPLLLALLAYGCGSLVVRLAGVRLPGLLVLPCGFAVIIVLLDAAVRVAALRSLAVPIVVAVAAVGLVLAWPFARPPLWPTLAAVGVFAAFAAPIVLSGHATFAGYIKLDDTATFWALTDSAFSHGLSAAGLAHSSYERTLWFYFVAGYPLGSFLPLGLGHRLLGQDIAWLFAPYLAFVMAMLAVALEAIAAAIVRPAWQRAGIAFIAAQPALLYGYALWGGVKEIVAAALIGIFVALCPLGERMLRARAWIPAALVALAMVASETVGGLVWLLPAVGVAVLVGLRSVGLRRLSRSGVWIPAALGAGAIVASLTAGGFIEHNLNSLRGDTELGNLIRPLNGLQILGIWPTGDFRVDPSHLSITHVLVALVALAGAVGVVLAALRGAWPVVLYLVAGGVGALFIGLLGSPWVAAKALSSASPAFVFVALVGAAAIAGGRLRNGAIVPGSGRIPEAIVIAVAVAGGVLWSNALAYHDASLAPHAQLTELERIGSRIARQGPTLMTEYQPYGVRHLLRAADPEGASELRYRLVPLRDGSSLPKGATADTNSLALGSLLIYRTLVLRTSPLASRPPAPFVRTFAGRYYDVWQRPAAGSPPILNDLALGAGAGDVPNCAAVTRLAATPGVAALAAAPAPSVAAVTIALASLGASPWPPGGGAGQVALTRPASVATTIDVPAAGRYAVWIAGSVTGPISVTIDAAPFGRLRNQLQYAGQYALIGSGSLAAGRHTVRLVYHGSDWRPGSAGMPIVGPLVIASAAQPSGLLRVAPSAARQLCGRRLYWVEALGA